VVSTQQFVLVCVGDGGTLQTMGTAQHGGVTRRKHAWPDKLQVVNKLVGAA